MAISRRQFLEYSVAASVLGALQQNSWAAPPAVAMQYRTLGRTGERVSIVGLGGFHIGR